MIMNFRNWTAICAATVLLTACGGETANGDGASMAAKGSAPTPERQARRVDDRVELPDWFPRDIELPDDFETTQVLQITAARMVRGITGESFSALVERYPGALTAAGYEIRDANDMPDGAHLLVFSGKDLNSSSVRIVDDGDRRELQFGIKFKEP